jgi:pimeloyl-ACP methyl ester carboxylesterase
MAHFVLVHGGWSGAWCWAKVAPLLKRAGHTVDTFDLPGMGEDPTPRHTTSLASYAERVVAALDASPGEAVLVGHSMGGLSISQAAEARPEKIRVLVYLAAFLLRNGQMLREITETDREALVEPSAVVDGEQGTMSIRPEKAGEVFYHDCNEDDVMTASRRLVPQTLRPLVTPIHVTEARYGSVKRVYIECLQDRAITIAAQRRMVQGSPCAEVHSLDCSHSPFLSQPQALAALFGRIAGA